MYKKNFLLGGVVAVFFFIGLFFLFGMKPKQDEANVALQVDAAHSASRSNQNQGSGAVVTPEKIAEAEPSEGFGAWAMKAAPKPDFSKIEAFEGWMERWKAASPEERKAMEKEGSALAQARRSEFKSLIMSDPRQALERSVPRVVRQDLPTAIVKELEKPVSSTGDLKVYKGRPAPGQPVPEGGLTMRYMEADGASYHARVYGEFEPYMSKKQIPFRGVALDRELAISESPIRQLEVGERIQKGVVVEETCPVSEKTTTAVAVGQAVAESTPTIEVGTRVITLCNGSHVTVMDDKYRVLVQAAGSGASFYMESHPGNGSRAIGNLRCLYIRATYPDQMAAPNTEEEATSDMQNTARFFLENSYGKLTTTSTITPVITLPQTLSWYSDLDLQVDGLGVLQRQARIEARKLGYDSAQYDCIILRVNGGLRYGYSWGGGDSVWLAWGGMDVINHEVGHSLGVSHANYWSTNDGTAYGNGGNQEYGNPFDVMGGGGGFGAHYNVTKKRQLGWLPSNQIHYPVSNGVYRIHGFDQPRLEQGKYYALSVPKGNGQTYNIEFNSANWSLSKQAMVLLDSWLIDTTPNSAGGKNDGGIQLGRTYSDPQSNQHFTLLAVNATNPPSIDLSYQRGPFIGNVAPTANLAASATSVAVNGSVTFTATAADSNGDALAYHWSFSDGVTGTNDATFTRSFGSVGQITAMLTVSDMKGGEIRRSVVITVGAPATKIVSGTVTSGGVAIGGVMISDGSSTCFSNSDGTYSLPNVATGSRNLTATLAGHTFTPSLVNPITVSANVTNANWAGTSKMVIISKIQDAVEGGANGIFRLTRTGDTTAALVVNLSSVTGTATKSTDYSFSPDASAGSLTIPAGSATLDVTVTPTNDTLQEGPETIGLQMNNGADYWASSSTVGVMTLIDNDTTLPQVSVVATDPTAIEGADNASFTFSRKVATATALDVTVAWGGTAVNGVNYQSLPTIITIPANQTSIVVPLTILNDSLIETPKSIAATINDNAAYVVDAGLKAAWATVSDDDTPSVSVSVQDSAASETGRKAAVFLIQRTGSTAAPLNVYYGVSGSASHGTDFTQLSGEVLIPAGQSSAPVLITPYDDVVSEGSETVTLALATYNDAYSLSENYQGQITIADNNDLPLISVSGRSTGTEGNSNASFAIKLTGVSAGNVTVKYTISGTATSGSDYTALSGSVSIPASNSNEVIVNVPILNDTLAEGTENVVMKITTDPSYLVYNDGVGTTLIYDNDSGSQAVKVSSYHHVTSEGGTLGQLYFSRGGTSGALSVNYALSGTATNGTDYNALSGVCVISDGVSGVTVDVVPVDDALAEGMETVVVTVTPGADYSVNQPSVAVVELNDNESTVAKVGFQQDFSTTTEQPDANGQFRDIAVKLSQAMPSAVTVKCVNAIGSTASGDDVDWTFVDPNNANAAIAFATVNFAPGTTSQVVRIRVKNDGLQEPSEKIILELQSASGLSIDGSKSQHHIFLTDVVNNTNLFVEERWRGTAIYDSQAWSSSAPYYTSSMTELATAQQVDDNYSRRITGQIVAPATGAYRFWIASDDGSRLYLSTTASATQKVQIANLNGAVGFQNWDAVGSQKSVDINLVRGQFYYIEVQHQEGSGGDHVAVAWEGPGFTRKPIAANSMVILPTFVRFVKSTSLRMETEATDPNLLVVLDAPAGAAGVSVNCSLSGTAVLGQDYTFGSSILTFAPGEQSKVLPLSLISDAVSEIPEGVMITLSNPVGVSLASPSSHLVTIQDAVAPVVNTLLTKATSSMASGTSVGTVTATATAGRTITAWTIIAGNSSNAFAVSAAGVVTLKNPSALPNPGGVELLVRATDSAGMIGDGYVNVLCNPPSGNGVVEERWDGSDAFWQGNWANPIYTGYLPTFTSPQNIGDDYSRRLTGYIKPTVTGNYTFWIASNDHSRLMLSTDSSPQKAVKIIQLDGWMDFQAWDSMSSQKSVQIPLEAGKVYWMEVSHREGSGGDHVSVAWEGPGIARQALPSSVIYPNIAGVNFSNNTVAPMVAISTPVSGSSFNTGNILIEATVIAGTNPITSVNFYDGTNLIGSDATAPYAMNWNPTVHGVRQIRAEALFAKGLVQSLPVPITVVPSQIYFDANGATAGSGIANGATITEGSSWSDDTNGFGPSDIWVDNTKMVFAAGSDATGNYIVNLAGNKTILGLLTRNGSPTLNGGSLLLNQAANFDIQTGTTQVNSTISGAGALNKVGAGTLILKTVNSYTGGLNINQGMLSISGSSSVYDSGIGSSLNSIAIAQGANLTFDDYRGAGYHLGKVTLNGGSLTLNGGDLNLAAANMVQFASAPGAISGAGQWRRRDAGNSIDVVAAASGSTISVAELNLYDYSPTFSIADGTNANDLSVSSLMTGGAGFTKTGTGTLSVDNTLNSFTGNINVNAGKLSIGVFNGNAATCALGAKVGSRSVIVNAPGTMEWSNNNIYGGGGMIAANLPTIAVNGSTFTTTRFNTIGNITLNSAQLINANSTDPKVYNGFQFLGNVIATGIAPSTISSTTGAANHLLGGATTTIQVTDAAGLLNVSNILRDGSGDYPGVAALQKAGLGLMVLNAANEYSGATLVSAGELRVNGSTASESVVRVASAAKLSGTGNVAGSVNISSGGNISPGANAIGTLKTGGLSLSGAYVCEMNATTSDKIEVTGALTLNAGSSIVIAASAPTATSYVIATYTGALTGTPNVTGIPSGYRLDLSTAQQLKITKSASDFDTWISAYTFAAGADKTATGDPDKDGRSNRMEYAFGQDPAVASSSTLIWGINRQTGTFNYTRRKVSLTGLTYKVWTSTNLVNWTQDTGATQAATASGNNENVAVTLSGSKPLVSNKLFMRVSAE